MALTLITDNVLNITALSDKPNSDDGLTPAQLKAKFDKAGSDIKTFINNTMIPEIEDTFATKDEISGIALGTVIDGSITPAKLSFDPATQVELDTVNNKIRGLVGSIVVSAKNTALPNTLKCNGAAISRTTYSDLFAVIGTTYGVGDGSTTFNLPDLRGEFIRGWDDSRGIDTGRSFASSQSDSFKTHTHSGETNLAGEHSHTVDIRNMGSPTGVGLYNSASVGTQNLITSSTAPDHKHTFTTNATGGTETRPRNIAMLYCIYY